MSKKDIKYPNKEYFYKLSVGFDTKSYLVSLMKPVNPKKQYTDKYAHRASQSITMKKSYKSIANILKKRFKPRISLEIGSNDGVFLTPLKTRGVDILGVEPAKNLSHYANKNKIETINDFFSSKVISLIFSTILYPKKLFILSIIDFLEYSISTS